MVTTDTPITFGRYKGYVWESLVNLNPGYIIWAHHNVSYSNIPDHVYKAARKVQYMRSRVDGYDGHTLTPNWKHRGYLGG